MTSPSKKTWLALVLSALASFEGMRTVAYLDPVGVPTICFGYTYGVEIGDTTTPERCDALLLDEAIRFGLAVSNSVAVPLSHEEQAAYTSFAYNVGTGAFKSSTLLRKLNAGDHRGACNELTRWVYAKGIKLPGLVKRRAEERELCLSGLNDANTKI
ncbi:lysozyme [Marinobacterium lutimaris]|uniref:Lysozyme n=1 Tax=Marinobacterium lutimaris TaxID=568106 RepID=A0A1H5Y9S2_9GAMM|nr:lysozyme [Marinobacterium lutimaris]SEG20803.1 lysozyme [Marinobacterium lutimaris]